MNHLNISHHSQSDLIRETLAYEYYVQAFPYLERVREKLDALFASLEGSIKHVHTDPRRSIHEYNGDRKEENFSIQKFEVHSADVPLGNHFHKKSIGHIEPDGTDLGKLSELFVFDEGRGLVLLQDLSPEGEALGKVREIAIRAYEILVIPPNQAHTLFMEKGSKFRGFRPYPFNPSDMDLNPYKLELPKMDFTPNTTSA